MLNKALLLSLINILLFSNCSTSDNWERENSTFPSHIRAMGLRSILGDTLNVNCKDNLLNGKTIVIDLAGVGSIHPLHWNLPKDLRSTIADSISTIICIEANKKATGNHQVGPSDIVPFYQYIWKVSIISLSEETKSVVYKKTFVGEKVMSNYTRYNYTIGQDSNGEIVLIVPNSQTNPRNYIVERDAELILGNYGGAELNNGQHLLGVVGKPPIKEALNWILETKKWEKGANIQRTLWEKIFK